MKFVVIMVLMWSFLFGVEEIHPGILQGYLTAKEKPSSLALLRPAPKSDSLEAKRDKEISDKLLTLQGTKRWALAREDANIYFPKAADIFSCALGINISKKETPHLYTLLRRTLTDAGYSTEEAKKAYKRERPFMQNHKPICTPEDEKILRQDGSYPSGHTALGWAWALILAEIAPQKADAILARGMAYGESRMVCNVHWQSDVDAGRTMGSAIVAVLHANSAFQKDLQQAKEEYQRAVFKGTPLKKDCSLESQAMQMSSDLLK